MILLIIIIVIFTLFGALIGEEDYYGGERDRVAGAAVGFFVGLVLGFFVILFSGIVFYNGTYTTTQTVKLESLVDGSDIRGSFFLGSGVINEVSVFTWYEQSEPGSYRQEQADADVSTVHFTTDAPHYVLTVKRREEGSWFGKWGIRTDAGEGLDWRYDFYVPKGTIKNNYTLDAQ